MQEASRRSASATPSAGFGEARGPASAALLAEFGSVGLSPWSSGAVFAATLWSPAAVAVIERRFLFHRELEGGFRTRCQPGRRFVLAFPQASFILGAGSSLPDDGDRLVKAGRLKPDGRGGHSLEAALASEALADFEPDWVAVVRVDATPTNGVELTGTPELFQRLARREGQSGSGGDTDTVVADLVAKGRRIFLEERFGGNGRTCGTCHVERNNFTLDPKFIADLPRNDPLFVAERDPALVRNFENPTLLRKLGLVLTNPDGFDDLDSKFALRAVQPTLALAHSSAAPDPFQGVDFTGNGRNPNPPERLGWSNDRGILRDFATGAVIQHFSRTLARQPGIDFRLPTDAELDALAAFQLSLGRQEDFDLKTLKLKSPLANRGQALFLDTGLIGEPGHKNCNACHFNAGATAAVSFNPAAPGFSPVLDGNPMGVNANETPLALTLKLPRDGGFGTLPLPNGGCCCCGLAFPPPGSRGRCRNGSKLGWDMPGALVSLPWATHAFDSTWPDLAGRSPPMPWNGSWRG